MRCATPHGFTHRSPGAPSLPFIVGQYWMPILGQCSMLIDTTVSRKPKWSLRNGASTTTPNARTHRSVTGRQPHSPSRQNPSPSTRHQTCNSLSLRLVQNIGQAITTHCVWTKHQSASEDCQPVDMTVGKLVGKYKIIIKIYSSYISLQ